LEPMVLESPVSGLPSLTSSSPLPFMLCNSSQVEDPASAAKQGKKAWGRGVRSQGRAG
jgi:hypothetical protein